MTCRWFAAGENGAKSLSKIVAFVDGHTGTVPRASRTGRVGAWPTARISMASTWWYSSVAAVAPSAAAGFDAKAGAPRARGAARRRARVVRHDLSDYQSISR